MNIPAELKYTEDHEWARLEGDGSVTIGITDHAQAQLGDVVFLELPELGRALETGAACAVIESVKAASDIYAPIAGEVIAINSEIADNPEQVNQDAYAAWLFRIQPADAAEVEGLLSAEAYSELIR